MLVMGVYVKLKFFNGLIWSYLVVFNDNEDYVFDDWIIFGVVFDEKSWGGLLYFYNSVKVGDIIKVGRVIIDIKVVKVVSNYIFIVGGIGIMVFLRIMEGYCEMYWGFCFYYVVCLLEDILFCERL